MHFLQKHNTEPKGIKDESELNYLKPFERGRVNENSLNDTYMKKKMGKVVLFGDIIHLFHIKSGKYLQILPRKLANDERENYRIGIDVNGDRYSWIQMCPRYKIDRDGDRILSNAEIYLKVAAQTNEYIHTALRGPTIGYFREINCSLELTSWRISIYQSATDMMQKQYLLASQLVYIHETKSLLSVVQNNGKDLKVELNLDGGNDDSDGLGNGRPGTGGGQRGNDDDDDDGEYFEDEDDNGELIVLTPAMDVRRSQ